MRDAMVTARGIGVVGGDASLRIRVLRTACGSAASLGQEDRGKIAAWRLVNGVGYSGVPTRGTVALHSALATERNMIYINTMRNPTNTHQKYSY